MGIYGTTKRGLDYLTRALVKEMADTPIVIGKIRPGMIITEAVVREARTDPEGFEKSRSTMNNLVDTVETVSPFLVDRILATEQSGTRIRWLNPAKMTGRMLVGLVRSEIGPIAKVNIIQWAPGLPKTRSGKIMRRILRKVAANEIDNLGDTSTLADPSVVENLIENRLNK